VAICEYADPVSDRPVAGDDNGAFNIARIDKLKKQMRLCPVQAIYEAISQGPQWPSDSRSDISGPEGGAPTNSALTGPFRLTPERAVFMWVGLKASMLKRRCRAALALREALLPMNSATKQIIRMGVDKIY